ncbi:MAG: hypothetical protein N2484_08805 [Clostridia bacterium]|nr:hypothetical protein [Clostridia bacterium]
MEFVGEVLRDVSFDPNFKIKFSYEDNNVCILKGFAEVTRKAPKPVIRFDADTEMLLRHTDRTKLELELLNIMISYIFAHGVARTWKGGIILNTA